MAVQKGGAAQLMAPTAEANAREASKYGARFSVITYGSPLSFKLADRSGCT